MLITYYCDLLTPAAMTELAATFHCSEDALYLDWERRAKWEPFIWENYEAHEDGLALVRQLQLARETALVLMKNTRLSGNVRVGAIARFTEAVKTEVELKQSLGVYPRAKMEHSLEVESLEKVSIDVNETTALLQRYEVILRREAAAKASSAQQDSNK